MIDICRLTYLYYMKQLLIQIRLILITLIEYMGFWGFGEIGRAHV